MNAQMPLATTSEPVRRVRAWFGPHLICEHAASHADAHGYAYAETMPFQFDGLRVAVSQLGPYDSPGPLPSRNLWPLTVG